MKRHAQDCQSLNAHVHEEQRLEHHVCQGTFMYAKGACDTAAPVLRADMGHAALKPNIAIGTCADCLKGLHHDNQYLQLMLTGGCIKVTEAKAVQTCDISEGNEGKCGDEGNSDDAVEFKDQPETEPWVDQLCEQQEDEHVMVDQPCEQHGDDHVIQTVPEGLDAHSTDAQRISTLSGALEPCEGQHCSEDSAGGNHHAKREGDTTVRRPTPHPSYMIINPEQGKPKKTTFLQTLSHLLHQGHNRLQKITQRKPKD